VKVSGKRTAQCPNWRAGDTKHQTFWAYALVRSEWKVSPTGDLIEQTGDDSDLVSLEGPSDRPWTCADCGKVAFCVEDEYRKAALEYIGGKWSHPGYMFCGAEELLKEEADAKYRDLGNRYLLVAVQGEERMHAATYGTLEELAQAVAEHAQDRDYGVAALVDLLTREPIPFRVSCVLGEGFTPHVERRDQ
jgi:hypothetical protein